MSKKYYLGLDIGTNSVGWAVTDENYNLCKYAGKRMWGIRLFEGGETAEQRRISRSNRRRLSRKKQRIDLLQELFAEEIAKMDPTFFIRLNESRLHLEDKSTGEKFPLFTDKDYTDIQYYKEYPTMYHLRKELIENPKAHDIRLVYLACHHILKNRGHFLINGSFSDVKKLSSVCESMLNSFNGISKYQIEINDIERLEEILSDRKKQKSVKAKELIQIFECGPCEDKTDEKTCKAIVSNLCKWLTGLKGNINSIFDMQFEEIDTSSFSFTELKYEDTISAALEEKYPDYADVIQKIKAVYDWSVLVDHADLNSLYDELTSKLETSIYKKRPANQLNALEKGKEKFKNIQTLREKAQIIKEMLIMYRCDATTVANLKAIGGSANAGNMAYNKNTLPTKKLILIHQSVTGLFETEEELV